MRGDLIYFFKYTVYTLLGDSAVVSSCDLVLCISPCDVCIMAIMCRADSGQQRLFSTALLSLWHLAHLAFPPGQTSVSLNFRHTYAHTPAPTVCVHAISQITR